MSEHYFSPEPVAASRPASVDLVLPDLTLRLATDRGVFSADRVDPGTRYLLAEAPRPPETGVLVDVGCGYGPIALTLATRSPGATVWAVDVNARAVDLCAANATTAGLSNVTTALPADVPPSLSVDAIYSNLPIRVGKAALHALVLEWLGRLRPDGFAVFVVHRHLGSDSLQRWLDGQGFTPRRLGSRQGYRLLQVTR